MKNRKGFTLVELLVTVVVLGIITGMSIPLIRNIRLRNEQRRYNTYGDSIVSAAKIYVDSYEEDLFGHKKSGCVFLTYTQLKEKNLIKDFSDSTMSCDSDDTLVRIVKLNKQYGYGYQLYCGAKGINGRAENAKLVSSSTSRRLEQVLKRREEDFDADEFDEQYCSLDKSMEVRIEPESNNVLAKSHSPHITLVSSTGINPGSSIHYAWIEADDLDGTTSVIYDTITSWHNLVFKTDSADIQNNKILSGNNLISSKPMAVTTPNAAPAYYLLVMKIDNFRDLEGEYYTSGDEGEYRVVGVYNVGKEHTITYHNNGGSGCSSDTALKSKTASEHWGELCIPEKAGNAFVEWNTAEDGSGETISEDTLVSSDLDVYAQWRDTGGLSGLGSGSITVTFDKNITGHSVGTVSFDSKEVNIGEAYGELPTSTRTLYGFDAYQFAGWYTAKTGGTKITNSSIVENEDDHILYAHWTDKAVLVSSYMNYNRKMDLKSGKLEKQNPIITWKKNGTVNQDWYMTDNSDGSVFFKTGQNKSWCVDVPNGTMANKTVVQLWTCNSTIAQKFKIKELGNHVVQIQAFKDTSFCLNVNGANILTYQQLQIYKCSNGDDASLWFNQKPNDTTPPTCGAVSEYNNTGNVYEAKCNDTGVGCTNRTVNFRATFTTDNATQYVTIFDRAGNERKCTANYLCANVTYKDGTTCSKTCGGGTYNRLAYAKSNASRRCPHKDTASGGSACNTKACTVTYYTCRVGTTCVNAIADWRDCSWTAGYNSAFTVTGSTGSYYRVSGGRYIWKGCLRTYRNAGDCVSTCIG